MQPKELIINRGDKTINLCEMKYVNGKYSISKEYADRLMERREAFRSLTSTDKALHLTMITSEGLEHNEGWHSIQNELTLDDLFR